MERWDRLAEEHGMTRSDWLASMVEAGIKAARGFEPGVGADETPQDLREQRNELRDELEAARGRVSELENRVFGAERREAEEHVRENPGCTHSELVSHLQATVPGRMGRLTDGLVVDERPDGREGYYHPGDEGGQATPGSADFVAGTGLPARGDR